MGDFSKSGCTDCNSNKKCPDAFANFAAELCPDEACKKDAEKCK
ncbi:MAG TPA: hypothetical protein PKA10_03420 [Selenomonadales bacterium]|nr:hypothetical protein [Selenomonadales bacterium]